MVYNSLYYKELEKPVLLKFKKPPPVEMVMYRPVMPEGESHAIPDEFKVELPVNDMPVLVQAISQFQNFLSEIQGYVDYFNQYSDPSPSADGYGSQIVEVGIF